MTARTSGLRCICKVPCSSVTASPNRSHRHGSVGGQVGKWETCCCRQFVNSKEQQAAARGLIELTQDLPPIREVLISTAVPMWWIMRWITISSLLKVSRCGTYYLAHSEEDAKPLFRGVFPEIITFQQAGSAGLELGMQPRIKVEVLAVNRT